MTVSSLTSDQKHDPQNQLLKAWRNPTLYYINLNTPPLNARPGGIPLMLLLARVGGGGDGDHDRDHPQSKAPPSLEGFSWRTPSAASSTPRGLTRRHSPSEKPRLIELAGSCFTLVPSLPFLRQPSMTAFLHFTIRQLPSGGRGEEAEQQLAVISPLSSAKEEGAG